MLLQRHPSETWAHTSTNGHVNPRQYAGELVVLSTLTGSCNSTLDYDIYDHPTDQQLRYFQNRLLQLSSCGPPSLTDGTHSAYSELCSQNYLWQEEVRPLNAISEGQSSLVACSSEGEVQMLLVDIQGTARTGADIHSTILNQRHGGPAALNTSLGDTQPSHPAENKNKVRESFHFGCWPRGMEVAARRY